MVWWFSLKELGTGEVIPRSSLTLVAPLTGIPIKLLSAGSTHCYALTGIGVLVVSRPDPVTDTSVYSSLRKSLWLGRVRHRILLALSSIP